MNLISISVCHAVKRGRPLLAVFHDRQSRMQSMSIEIIAVLTAQDGVR